jgi:hypothetical protein
VDWKTQEICTLIYELLKNGQEELALDFILDEFNTLLLLYKYEQCDEILRVLDINQLTSTLAIGILTITAAAKEKLKQRPAIFILIRDMLNNTRSENVVDNLLKGLE